MLTPPGVEARPRRHVGGQPDVIEVEDLLVVHHEAAPARPVGDLVDLPQHLGVMPQEVVIGVRVVRVPLPLDQARPDEDLPGRRLVDHGVVDQPLGDDRDAQQGHLLVGDNPRRAGRPVRLGVAASQQVPADLLNPLRRDGGDHAGPQTAGLDQFHRHHQLRWAFGQRRARLDREPGPPGPHELGQGTPTPLLRVALWGRQLQADVAEQTGQHRDENRLVAAGRYVSVHVEVLADLLELGVQVLPFPHPQEVQVLVVAEPAELVGGQLTTFGLQVPPQPDDGDDVAARVGRGGRLLELGGVAAQSLRAGGLRSVRGVAQRFGGVGARRLSPGGLRSVGGMALGLAAGWYWRLAGAGLWRVVEGCPGQCLVGVEPGVQPVGLVTVVGGALPDVLDRQKGRDHQNLAQAATLICLDQHPGQSGVDRQFCELVTNGGQPHRRPRLECTQFLQQPDAVPDLGGVRGLDEGEAGDVAQPGLRHLQDHRGQVGAQDLGFGELGT